MGIPFNCYYTISSSLLLHQFDKFKEAINDKVSLNIFLESASCLSPDLISKIALLKNNYIFSVSAGMINNPDTLSVSLPVYFLLTVLNPSVQIQGLILPVFSGDDDNVETRNTDLVKSYFCGQGIENVHLPVCNIGQVQNNVQIDNDCLFLSCSADAIKDISDLLFDKTTPVKPSDIIIITFKEEISDPEKLKKIAAEVKKGIEKSHESFGFYQLSEMKYQKKRMDAENQLWKKRALLYHNFLLLSKTVQEQEYYEILNWYKKEYEILPLWYKRVGHFLKVLMGERTFRSLFSDNVKKYKN